MAKRYRWGSVTVADLTPAERREAVEDGKAWFRDTGPGPTKRTEREAIQTALHKAAQEKDLDAYYLHGGLVSVRPHARHGRLVRGHMRKKARRKRAMRITEWA